MAQWITHDKGTPQLKQQILATIEEQGKPKVVACWYVEDNRIKLDQHPDSLTYAFAIVKAWQPFPEPYQG